MRRTYHTDIVHPGGFAGPTPWHRAEGPVMMRPAVSPPKRVLIGLELLWTPREMQSDTPRPARSNRIHRWLVELTLLALVLAAAGVVLFSGLGDSAPVGDEALHAIISHDSAAAHRWLPLRLPSGPYYMMKPPLRFLINIAIMRWCGTEMRLLRFPDAFSGGSRWPWSTCSAAGPGDGLPP